MRVGAPNAFDRFALHPGDALDIHPRHAHIVDGVTQPPSVEPGLNNIEKPVLLPDPLPEAERIPYDQGDGTIAIHRPQQIILGSLAELQLVQPHLHGIIDFPGIQPCKPWVVRRYCPRNQPLIRMIPRKSPSASPLKCPS